MSFPGAGSYSCAVSLHCRLGGFDDCNQQHFSAHPLITTLQPCKGIETPSSPATGAAGCFASLPFQGVIY